MAFSRGLKLQSKKLNIQAMLNRAPHGEQSRPLKKEIMRQTQNNNYSL